MSDRELLIQLKTQVDELTKKVDAVTRDNSELKKDNSELKNENNELQKAAKDTLRDKGLESAIKQGVKTLERVFAPLQSLAMPHSYAEGEAETIDELRASLARPNFDGLETNFGRRPSTGNQTGGAA